MIDHDNKIFGKNPNPNFLDLRVGNPGIMEEFWSDINNSKQPPPTCSMGYIQHGIDSLIKEIIHTHIEFENLDDPSIFYKNIVVGNGATHVLQAALYALKKKSYNRVVTGVPYWPRFKSLADMHNIPFKPVPKSEIDRLYRTSQDIVITTIPNNPDGVITATLDNTTIWDASYHWPQYYANIRKMQNIPAPITVFSLAKATGHASTRIGWAIVTMDDIADEMRNYVELTTSGVSLEAQLKACEVLQGFRENRDQFEGRVKETLALRKRFLASLKIDKQEQLFFLHGQGMFEYLVVNEKYKNIFDEIGVSTVTGEAFGDDNRWHRLNLACHTSMWNLFVQKLKGFVDAHGKR